jgi:L-serine dehydratase
MREVGESLPASLRETGLGGLAGTATGMALKRKIFGGEGYESGIGMRD